MAATEVPAAISKMFLDETSFQDAVSEPLAQKIAANINALITSGGAVLGQIKPCYLTEAQFASQAGYDHTAPIASRKWAIMDGQDISGSDFATLTGITTLPLCKDDRSFLRQAGSDAQLGLRESSQNKSHAHDVNWKLVDPNSEVGGNDGISVREGDSPPSSMVNGLIGPTASEGGTEARPNAYSFNIFIKINN